MNTDFYKERWYSSLKREWIQTEEQQEFCFNAPVDMTDKQMKELTVETKVEDIDPNTQALRGFKWNQPSGADNELWDLLVYNNAVLDTLAYDLCVLVNRMDNVDWEEFWNYARAGAYMVKSDV